MKRIAAVAVFAFLALVATSVVFAQDYLADATQALQHASVYVAPGTPGTDADTAGKLQVRLSKNDNLVLVMLPAAAETQSGTDINGIVTLLSENLGNQRIIGLAVGNNVVGYAPSLPAGVASDQMRRAKSVSNDPVTALTTFVQNMHNWQKDNPQPTPTPTPKPTPIPSTTSTPESGNESWTSVLNSWMAWTGYLVVLLVLIIIYKVVTRRR